MSVVKLLYPILATLLTTVMSIGPLAAVSAETAELPATTAASAEEIGSFLQRYLEAKQKAKSEPELQAFFARKTALPAQVLQLNAAKRAAFDKMSAEYFQEEKNGSPGKIEIQKIEKRGSDTLVTCIATEYKDKDKANSGAYFKGKYLLRASSRGWLIVEEFWTHDDGNGRFSQHGTDPEQPHQTMVLSADDIYKEAVEKALSKIWPEQNSGEGDVIFELQNNSRGKFVVLVVSDKKGNLQAEARVRAALAKLVLPPLPLESKAKILHVELTWSPSTLDGIETQYFTEPFFKQGRKFKAIQ